ncbi:hypothetical protein AABM34_19935 [Lysinibacillus fusiformis]
MIKKIKKSNQKLAIAFATGGFDWVAQGNTVALTELEAEKVLAETNANKKRDKASGAVYFTYTDSSNISHEVWYADQETLEKWVKYVQRKSYHDVVLWRAGGLGVKTLQWINEQETGERSSP